MSKSVVNETNSLIRFDHKGTANRFCLVAVQIGEIHASYWHLAFRKSWHAYAKRHGYDIAIIQDFIDTSAGKEAPGIKFQKLKLLEVPELSQYDKLVYLDSDILLLEHAPCIASATPAGKLGMISQTKIPYRDWYTYIQPLRGGEPSVEAYYKTHLLPQELQIAKAVDDVFNGGVMVMESQPHAAAFSAIFDKYKDSIQQKTGHIDQPLVSCEMSQRGLIHSLDFRFNVIFSMWFAIHYGFIPENEKGLIRSALAQTLPLVFFLHFPSMRGVEHLPPQYFDRSHLNTPS